MIARNNNSEFRKKRRVIGPSIGDPRLRSLPPPGSPPPRKDAHGPSITKLGCLASYDYLCHDKSCEIWHKCHHGGNRD
jgi:hypothetical protein